MIKGRLPLIIRSLLLFALSGLALQPLLGPTLTRTADGLLHLFRLVEIDHLAEQGVIFSRWAPDFLYGYGLPLFNFYSPLSYYLPLTLHLFGMSLIRAFNLSMALGVLLSGAALYLFLKETFGERAALVGGVAYMYAPYQLYQNFERGGLPESLAFPLLPLILWAFHRLATSGQRRYLTVAALFYSGLISVHNVSAMLFTPLLLLYLAGFLWLERKPRRWLLCAFALLLGLGLSAFYWLPALMERPWVQMERVLTPPYFDFHFHFLSLGQLFSPPSPVDTGLMNRPVNTSLGWPHLTLALIALLSLPKFRTRDQRLLVALSAVIAAILAFMTLPYSAPLWERIPLLAYAQWPHRLLVPLSLAISILAGGGIAILPERAKVPSSPKKTEGFPLQFLGTLVALVTLLTISLPLLYPRYHQLPSPHPSLVDMMEYEHERGTIGTTSYGEYLPRGVEWLPTESPLEEMYRSSSEIARLEPASLPQGSELKRANYHPLSASLLLYTPRPFQAVFHSFYFPGWQAYVDGKPVETWATRGLGLVTFPVPAGEHSLLLRFQETPVRWVADLVSAASLLMLALLAFYTLWARPRGQSLRRRPHRPSAFPLRDGELALYSLLALSLLLLKVGYLDSHDSGLKWSFDGQRVRGVENPLSIDLGGEFTLLGYDLDSDVIEAGQTLHLSLYWKAQRTATTDYSAFAHLIDPSWKIIAQRDNLHPGQYPTNRWRGDEYNKDDHPIPVPAETPPGRYLLVVGLYNPQTLQRLPVRSERGDPPEDAVILQSITVSAKTTGG